MQYLSNLSKKKAMAYNRDETSNFHLIFSIVENLGEKFSQVPQLPADRLRNVQEKSQPWNFKALHN